MPSPPLSVSTRWPWIVGMLVIALLGSNVWWAYQMIDAGQAANDQAVARESVRAYACHLEAVAQTWGRALPADSALARARTALPPDGFQKDGWHIIGHVALRPGGDGRLSEVRSAIQPSPCP